MDQLNELNPFDHPICLSPPLRIAPSAWLTHVPFAMYLVDLLEPKIIVELGTHYGVSYCAFCQAVSELSLNTRCYAVDTWTGDLQAGLYGSGVLVDLREHHDPLYSGFSKLIQSTFDEAQLQFEDGSIDLLHIDGYHTYESVKHDWETWLPKISDGGVVLFHDIHVQRDDFGVWKLWGELKKNYPSFEMIHGHGLGLLVIGDKKLNKIKSLISASADQVSIIQKYFWRLGVGVENSQIKNELRSQLSAKEKNNKSQFEQICDLKEKISNTEKRERELHSQLIKNEGHLEKNILELSTKLVEAGHENANLRDDLQKTTAQLRDKDIVLTQINSKLLEIYGSSGWRLVKKLWRIRLIIAPKGSMREKIGQSLGRRIKNLIIRGKPRIQSQGDKKTAERSSLEEKTKQLSVLSIENFTKILQDLYLVASGEKSDEYINFREIALPENDLAIKPIAFYLPQYHPIPENDLWWGKGFTEWTNVTRAVPLFEGHYQPRLPGELGFYDLRIPDILRRQVDLAKNYGLFGFCFYYYWFNGKRLLDMPLDLFMNDQQINFPFCVCWANENWSRRWDGLDENILISQNHTEESDLKFIHDVSDLFSHPDYIKIDGHPLLLVYRAQLLPNPERTVLRWKKYCWDLGIPEPYLVAAQVFGFNGDPNPFGFDAAVEFPPNTLPATDIAEQYQFLHPDFEGRIYDYKEVSSLMRDHVPEEYTLFKTVMPSWDNSARKFNQANIFVNNSPREYEEWVSSAIRYTKRNLPDDRRLFFINAWNEWAEAAYLEPDRKFGYAYLEATANALQKSLLPKNTWTLLFISHNSHLGGAQLSLLSILRWFKKCTSINIKILLLEEGKLLQSYLDIGDVLLYSEIAQLSDTQKVEQLAEFCGGYPDLIYGNSVGSGSVYHWIQSLGVPILTHFRELDTSIEKYAAEWISDILKYTDGYIANSDAVRMNLIEKYGVDENYCHTAYTFIDQAGIEPLNEIEKKEARNKLGLTKDQTVIFGCGIGMPFRKGADLFFEIAQNLLNRGEKNFHFYWIGDFLDNESDPNHGIWKDYLEKYTALDLSKKVTLLGIVDNPLDYLNCGDIFLLTSREEAIGRVVLEAAECRLPILCFADAGGAPEFVQDDAGFVVPYEDLDAMAEKTITLMHKNGLREDLGNRAYQRLISDFSEERIMPKILHVSRQLAKKKPKISIVVTNYNHAQYLPQRLESIFNQTYQDFEIFLMDDKSTDDSLEIINQYSNREDVNIIINTKNIGSPFKQWKNIFPELNGEIVWIAESDDLNEPDFLEKLLPAFDDPDVHLAYCASKIINEAGDVEGDYRNLDYLKSISTTRWNESFCIPADQEINEAFGIKNTILNMSAVLFRNMDWQKKLLESLDDFYSGGDTYLLLNIMKGGKVSFHSESLNYHRRLNSSIVGKILSDGGDEYLENFFRDFSTNKEYVVDNFQISFDFFDHLETYLHELWSTLAPGRPIDDIEEYFSIGDIRNHSKM